MSTWHGGHITLANDAVFNNSGTFNITSVDQGVTWRMQGAGTFNNSGTFTKAAQQPGTISIEIPFNHEPTANQIVTAHDGTLQFRGGGRSTGVYEVGTDADVQFLDGPQQQSRTYDWTSTIFRRIGAPDPGVVTLSSTVLLGEGSDVNVYTYFLYLRGTVNGPGSIAFNRQLDWFGGTMENAGVTTVANGVTANIHRPLVSLADTPTLDGRRFINHGMVNLEGSLGITAALRMANSAVFENRGTFSFLDDSSILRTEGNPQFLHYGTLEKTGGNGTSYIEVTTELRALVRPTGRAIRFPQNTSMLEGTIQLQGGTVIVDGTFQQDGGTVEVDTGTLTVNGQYLVNGGTVSLAGGTLATTQGLALAAGTLLSGSGALESNVTNAGAFVTGAPGGGTSGTITLAGNYAQTAGSTTVNGELDVTGTFTQSGGAVSVGASSDLSVSGAYSLSGGTAAVAGWGNTLSVGAFAQSGGTLALTSGGSLSSDSTVTVSGGTLVLQSGGLLHAEDSVEIQSGGTLTGSGGITIDAGAVLNAGTINVGGTGVWGTLAITGNYTQTGTLNMEISYNGYDQLQISGLATLGGTLNVSLLSYSPAPGMSFALLTYGSRSGTFGTLNLPGLGFGHWDPRYDNHTGTFTLAVVY
jgi:adhesin HecA-like repeat protein